MAFIRGLCFAVLLLVATPCLAAPLSAYGRLPTIETGAVSPSGHAVAVVLTTGEARRIAVKTLADNKVTGLADVGSAKVRDLQWAGDDHLILTTSVTTAPYGLVNRRGEWTMAYALDLKTKKLDRLMEGVDGSMNAIFDRPVVRMIDGQPVVILLGVYFEQGRGQLSLFRVRPPNGRANLFVEGDRETRDWAIGPDGEALAQTTYDLRTGRWALRAKDGLGWRELKSVQALTDAPVMLGLGRDARSVLIADKVGWREVSLETGVWDEADAAMQVEQPIYDPVDGRLIGRFALVGDTPRYGFFAAADQAAWMAVTRAFPKDQVYFISWSTDRQRILVKVDSPTEGPAFSVINMTTGRATWLGAQYAGLGAGDISPVQAVRYKAADGMPITGYLTLPRGRDPKNLPLVVFPHGGPAARDGPGFDWWAQAMASRGYAVLQPNYRGSDGFGEAFMSAGYGQWGRKMQTDLSDGVRALASKGLIDPKRVCIVGASYGGYAALAGATLDPGVYRCAASFGGVSDLRKQVSYSKAGGGNASLSYWTRFMGAEDARDPVLAQYSPALLADKAEIPILLIHGRDDTVVPLEQSRSMAEALRKAGKPVELVIQPGADHWLSLGDTRLAMLEAVVAFLEKHNPPT